MLRVQKTTDLHLGTGEKLVTATTAAPSPTGPEPLWRAEDFARLTGTNVGTVYRLIRQGDLRAVRVGRLVRIPESAVTEFIASGGSPQ